MEDRIEQLVEVDEIRSLAQEKNTKMQSQIKYLFDKKEKDRKFEESDMALLWNARCQDKGKHGKFEALWIGHFVITSKGGEDSYYLQNISREDQELPVHGQFLKHFFS